jgi:DNA-binding response OmpR family regulator
MILIIDDNKDLANIYRKFFALAGHEVSVAYGGEEGIAKAKEQKPAVMLCDIAMAWLNGYAVAQLL